MPQTHPSSSGKTSLESLVIEPMDSVASSLGLPVKMCRSSQQGEHGRTLVVCLAPKEQSHGGSSTPNISDWPNDAGVCLLSQVLEPAASIHARFYLSSKACAGILRRAAKRGKVLPIQLHRALIGVVQGSVEPEISGDRIPL